ncbi:MAG: 23S rRNA (guanosine(2251)-2'-O)-methyltransferase RlmB [Actinobacteria bacterium]|nr:23S rRNA (guanosine(2251)-2'-O)-methyltransferase RlmB [Actinomycetota bacterium]
MSPAKGGGRGAGRGSSGPGSGSGRGRSAPSGRGGAAKAGAAKGGPPKGGKGRPPRPGKGNARNANSLVAMGPQASKPRSTAKSGLGGEQVEGRQAVRELLLANRRDTREIWMASDLDPAPVLDDIRELAAEARVVVKVVGRGKLDAAARTDAPQGVIAFARPLPDVALDDLLRSRPGTGSPFLLLSDGITDPGNLGALLRSAECAGVTGVVLPQHRAVHITPTVTKAAAGSVEHISMALVGGMPSAIRQLQAAGVLVVGLDERAEKSIWDLSIGDRAVALVLGAEGPGLSRLVRDRCDELVSIPMRGRLASLNVATAGALACFEVARGR